MTHSVSSMKFWTLKCNIPSGFKHKVGEITSFRCCWFQHENSTRNAGPWVSVVGFRIPIYVRRRRKLEIFNCFWNATQCVLNNKRNHFFAVLLQLPFFSAKTKILFRSESIILSYQSLDIFCLNLTFNFQNLVLTKQDCLNYTNLRNSYK